MPLQKSFSDTNHSSKVNNDKKMSKQDSMTKYLEQQRRPQWNRNRSFGGPQTSKTNPPSKLLQDKPPIPVSSTTKNKLGIYQFTGQTIVDSKAQKNVISLLSDDEKENASVTVKGRGHLGHRKDMIDVDGQPVLRPELIGVDGQSVIDERAGALKSLDTTCSQKIKSNLPSTPAARLALPDLIGMEDVRRSVQDISPEDRIEWDRHSSNSSFGIRKTKRRRTRSSSPVSSPSHKNPQHHELQVDPGSELWGRYSLTRSNVPHPERSTIPALAQLMQTSSPQPSNPGTTPRSVAGFRRTNSCGTQFPKRRRVGGTDDNDVFTGSVSLGPSHLSVFIEKVQEGLVRPKQTESSSPSISILSGVSRLSGFIGEGERSGGAARLTESPSSRAWDQVPLQSRPRGSDYGEFDDDDLDDPTLLDSLTVQLGPPIANTSHLPYLPHPQMPSNRPGQNVSAESPHSPAIVVSKPSEPQLEQTKEDEFDEFDEELFAADLEGIVAQFDNGLTAEQTIPLSGAEDSKPQEVTFDKPESEDEFGDGGLDDIDFENAEATATQSLQHTSSSVLPVRTRYP
jgi:DNA replication ATP-dependent helicase Dna2